MIERVNTIISKDEYIELPLEEKIKFQGAIRILCRRCNYEYLDDNAKNYYNYDISRCPRCDNIISLRKRNKLIWNRHISNSIEAINFLNRKDMPDKIEAELYLKFNNRDKLLEFLNNNNIEGDINIIF
ncbi:MAG: hypothetical protein KatS3mg003_1893 [Candidatus Nitrosocaldaceae archaeon]|nr:MAG: hypothetical protein KatS3mg003_1893 [Candidatus Nitrosocaldaceae archaeon]